MPNSLQRRDPLRTGIFGITVVTCLVLVSFGYTKLPFWPHGQRYTAYFAHAGGIVTGNPVQVYGLTVGEVDSVELDISTRAARVSFTVDRRDPGGDQSLAAIKTDTREDPCRKQIRVTPATDPAPDGTDAPTVTHHHALQTKPEKTPAESRFA
ncbi:MCE family protein [Mycolicibacterium vaccae]|nr:MCE family protein [Mycolicibacterium vaccae]